MKEEQIEKLLRHLQKNYTHTYYIGRKEAKEELNVKSVVYADANLSDLMSKLYSEYANEMELQM